MMNGKPDLSVKIGQMTLKNPIIPASGTFGNGLEYMDFYDINQLGAITVKGITPNPKKGNSLPRIVETKSGMLNSVGLENPGIDVFIDEKLEKLKELEVPLIINISANTIEEYAEMARKLELTFVDAIEINVSCPNVSHGGIQFGTDPDMVYKVSKAVRDNFTRTIITKLSPNVTDIAIMAKSAEKAGVDAISLINTLKGIAIDYKTRKPILGNIIGGLSGPAIKPVALRMVYEVSQAVNIPIVGMGGVSNYEDALEFMIAGATAVSVGAMNFVNPMCCLEIINSIEKYMAEEGIDSVDELIGGIIIE